MAVSAFGTRSSIWRGNFGGKTSKACLSAAHRDSAITKVRDQDLMFGEKRVRPSSPSGAFVGLARHVFYVFPRKITGQIEGSVPTRFIDGGKVRNSTSGIGIVWAVGTTIAMKSTTDYARCTQTYLSKRRHAPASSSHHDSAERRLNTPSSSPSGAEDALRSLLARRLPQQLRSVLPRRRHTTQVVPKEDR
jgi:hypothetical protein